MIYLDTSALTKLVHAEPESAALYRWLVDGEQAWVASVLVEVELVRVVRRASPDALPAALALLRAIDIMPLDHLVVGRAQQLLDPGLRSLDAVHLATALEIGEVTAFVTYDQRLSKATQEHGIPAHAPG